MGDWRAEGGHDRISGVLVDRCTEPVEFGGESVEQRLEDPSHVLRIKALSELGRTHHVGEEHGDDSAILLMPAAGHLQGRAKRGLAHARHSIRSTAQDKGSRLAPAGSYRCEIRGASRRS